MSAISDGMFLFIIVLITVVFAQNRASGGSPDKFLTIIVFIQKFFIVLFDFSIIFSIILRVITNVIE